MIKMPHSMKKSAKKQIKSSKPMMKKMHHKEMEMEEGHLNPHHKRRVK